MRATLIFGFVVSTCCHAQLLGTGALTGKYFLRHVEFTTDNTNAVIDAESVVGSIVFDGIGNYSFAGQQLRGQSFSANFSSVGTYSIDQSGIVSMTNPQSPGLTINGRFGAEAVTGSSTEAPGNVFDMLVAIPAPTGKQSNASIQGTWHAADLELTGGSTLQVRDSIAAISLDGAGSVVSVALQGHSAAFDGGATVTQLNAGGYYNVGSDGSGTITFPAPSDIVGTGLMLGTNPRTLLVSRSGNVILAGSPLSHDMFVAIKTPANPVLALSPRTWGAGIRIDSGGSSASFVATGTVISAQKELVYRRRLHLSTNPVPLNITADSPYTLASDGTGSGGPTRFAAGVGTAISANVGDLQDPTGYQIFFGEDVPNLTGPGVFVNPQGIVNAASNAPVGDPIAPGEFIAIYGSGLAPGNFTATPPYPASLGGVAVTIGGFPASVYYVSDGQINCLVPYGVDITKPSVNITVTNNGVLSNQVTAPLAKTAPGVFSYDTSGTGAGAFIHVATGLPVTDSNPAMKGETLSAYLTGLGAVQNPVTDGSAPSPAVADPATTQVSVFVNQVYASVLYEGLNPVYPGLYQINFVVPSTISASGRLSFAIQTPDAYSFAIKLPVQ